MKTQISKVTSNPIGSAVGAIALFFIAKKTGHTTAPWMIGAVIAGVLVGAHVQAAFKSQKGAAASANLAKK